jgi:hypothetical protein
MENGGKRKLVKGKCDKSKGKRLEKVENGEWKLDGKFVSRSESERK